MTTVTHLQPELGERFWALRQSQMVTQEEVARGADLSVRTYTRIEYGDVVPTVPTLVRLAQFFGVTVDALLLGEPVSGNGEGRRLVRRPPTGKE